MENCKKCKKEYEIEVKEKLIVDDVKQIYFECPNCGDYNPVFRVNRKVEETDEDLQCLFGNIFNARKDADLQKKFINNYQFLLGRRISEIKMLSRR